MKLVLSKHEIARAVQVYVAAKTGVNARDVDVTLHPRARKGLIATVDVLRSARIPTLHDEVHPKEP
jgi:hypothetical protein